MRYGRGRSTPMTCNSPTLVSLAAQERLAAEVQSLVDGVASLTAQALSLIDQWEAERLAIAKLLSATFRTPEQDREFEVGAINAGLPIDHYRFRWVSEERSKRDRAIRGAQAIIDSLEVE